MTQNTQNRWGAETWFGLWLVLGLTVWVVQVGPDLYQAVLHTLATIRQGRLNGDHELATSIEIALLKLTYALVVKAYWLGGLAGLGLIALGLDREHALRPALAGTSLLAILPGLADLALPALAGRLGVEITGLPSYLVYWLLCATAGLILAALWLRHGVSRFEVFGKRFTKRSTLERNQRTDVRHIDRFLPAQIDAFDPLRYIDEKRGFFLGLDEQRRAVHIPAEDWRLSHILLSGRTRSGKGVAAQILLTQAIRRREFVVVLDPKLDAWMPHVFRHEAQRCGQPYYFLDLRPSAHPQIDLFRDCDAEAIENMLIAAFGLAEKGEAADYYRLKDRQAAREAALFVAANPGTTPAAILDQFAGQWADRADGFLAALREMAELLAVNRADGWGIDLVALEKTGGCLYVVGDMGNSRVVRMQRMLLVRLMVLARQRDYLRQAPRTITVFADEFKVHISRPFLTSLGAAAGWGMHCILAFQSLQDLADVPADLDKDAVRGAVMENCAIQLAYRIKDPETAEWLAASTGTILVDDESRRIDKNVALTETVLNERTVRQAERYLVDTNMLMNLPKGCGLLVGAGSLPSFCYTAPVSVERSEAGIRPTVSAPEGSVHVSPGPAGSIDI